MTASQLPRGTVTFLFSDIEGSTRLLQRHGDGFPGLLETHSDLIRQAIADTDGVEVRTEGDSFFVAFGSAADAVRAAVLAQRALAGHAWPEDGEVRVRIGLHTGEGTPGADDYIGIDVHRAARIADAAHGGQVVLSAATVALTQQSLPSGVHLRDMGDHSLKDLAEVERLYQLVIDGLPDEFPPLRTLDAVRHNLPVQISSFVGRERELGELTQLIEESRLLSVTGPGGSGKTRLSLQAAAASADRFPDGVWFVPLAPLTDGALIPAEMLGIIKLDSPIRKTRLESLCDQLASRETLLLLDNCEHVLEATAEVVAAVLQAAARVKVLTTSREPLGLTGEVAWPLPPMELPAEGEMSAQEIAGAEAVRLFVERASAARPEFSLDERNAAPVADICRRLDGLPLAIELAAARIRSLPVEEIDRRLGDRFRLLTRGDRAAVPRQQTLLATVQWSYDLLDDQHQELYRRLSVFPAGFTLDAAESVGASATVATEEIVDLLDHLVAQSLVVAEDDEHSTRYRMLENIRAHGLQLLSETGEVQAAEGALLQWVAQLAREASRQLEGPDQVDWIGRLELEHDNILSALGVALESDPVTGLTITTPMAQFWMNRAGAERSRDATKATPYLREGADWSQRMLDAAGGAASPELRGRALVGLGGWLEMRLGEFSKATATLEEAERVLHHGGDPRSEGWAVFWRGFSSWSIVPWPETIELFERSHRLFQDARDPVGSSSSGLGVGFARLMSGETARGAEILTRMYQEAHELPPYFAAHAAGIKAVGDLLVGQDVADVPDLLVEAIETFRRLRNLGCTTHTLQSVALHHARQGEMERAARVLGSAQAIRNRVGVAFAPFEDLTDLVAEAGLDQMDSRVRETAFAEGMGMSYDEGVEFALEGLANKG